MAGSIIDTVMGFLGPQVTDIRRLWRDLDGNALDHTKPVSLDPDYLSRVIGHQSDVSKSEINQDLSSDPIIPEVRLEPQSQVGLDGITTFILKLVGSDLVQ